MFIRRTFYFIYLIYSYQNIFTGYAAASPAVGWGNEVLYKYEKAFAEKKLAKPLRVYMTVGDVERGRSTYERFAAQMVNRNYTSVALKSKVLENTGHSGTKTETFSRGMQYVFEKPKLNLDAAVLNKYAGSYQSPTGNKIDIKNEDGKLALYFFLPLNMYCIQQVKLIFILHQNFSIWNSRMKVAKQADSNSIDIIIPSS